MKLNTVSQILDIVSFLTITPEFLSDDLLEKVAKFSLRAQNILEPWVHLVVLVGSGILLIVILLVLLSSIFHFRPIENALVPIFAGGYSDISIINVAAYFLPGPLILLGGAFILMRLTWLIARRGALFWFGAALFLANRILMIIYG